MSDSTCVQCARNSVLYETTTLHQLRTSGASPLVLSKQARRVVEARMVVLGIEGQMHPWQLQLIRGFAGAKPALPNLAQDWPGALCSHQQDSPRVWLAAAYISWTAAAALVVLNTVLVL